MTSHDPLLRTLAPLATSKCAARAPTPRRSAHPLRAAGPAGPGPRHRLAGSAPLALTALKGNFVQAEKVSFADYIRFEAERHGKLFASADTKEAFAAFVEKRKPVFQGK